MKDDSVRRQLIGAYLQELEEHVQTLNSGLLALEEGTLTEGDLHRLLRAAHSLKGASGAFHVKPVAEVCHWIEDRLVAARDGLLPEPQEFALLFAAVDAVQEAGQRLKSGEELANKPLVPWLEGGAPAGPVAGSVAVPATVAEAEHAAAFSESSYLRVAVERLDALYAGSGELLRARIRLQECTQALTEVNERVARWKQARRTMEAWIAKERLSESLVPTHVLQAFEDGTEELHALRQSIDALTTRMQADDLDLQSAVGRVQALVASVRLQPFGEICHGLERAVRDVARLGGKEVQLHISGTDVELDRSILSALRDPLLHLVRNAVDHGLETPTERERAGKSRTGQLNVVASVRGVHIEVVVSDDGRGLDIDAIRNQAARKGWAVPNDDVEAIRLIFRPGFSTARQVTDVSGRGVGLDVVKSQAEALHGTVDVFSEPGKGTSFVLISPLTLSSLRALMVRLGKQIYALPSTSVDRALRVGVPDLTVMADRPMLLIDGRAVPVAHLSNLLVRGTPAPPLPEEFPALLLGSAPRQALVIVDELLTEQELTIQSMGARISHPTHFSGASLLPDGRIILTLHTAGIIATVLEGTEGTTVRVVKVDEASRRQRRIMLVEDSMPVRTLEKAVLEKAGYQVVAAIDGQDAWEKLQENQVDLIVSDIQMPRMDGLQLLRTVRENAAWQNLPVVLVTSLGNEEQKFAGLLAGASAYLIKSEFDQQLLLDTIEELI